MAMLLHTINQAALVKSTDNSGNSCNMRVSAMSLWMPILVSAVVVFIVSSIIHMADGFVYALATAVVFGWLWPA